MKVAAEETAPSSDGGLYAPTMGRGLCAPTTAEAKAEGKSYRGEKKRNQVSDGPATLTRPTRPTHIRPTTHHTHHITPTPQHPNTLYQTFGDLKQATRGGVGKLR